MSIRLKKVIVDGLQFRERCSPSEGPRGESCITELGGKSAKSSFSFDHPRSAWVAIAIANGELEKWTDDVNRDREGGAGVDDVFRSKGAPLREYKFQVYEIFLCCFITHTQDFLPFPAPIYRKRLREVA